MTRFRPGDVVLVQFPFIDLSTSKRRPAVVLNPPQFAARQGDVVVMAMTSQPQRESRLRLSRWNAAGLPKPTWFKPVIGTIAVGLIVRRIGRLNAADLPRARLALRQAIASIFLR